jgi:hypothetical protein
MALMFFYQRKELSIRVRWYLWNLCYDTEYRVENLFKAIARPFTWAASFLPDFADRYFNCTESELFFLDVIDLDSE